jgi:low molecular weight protein-tyrosine phosphatase
MAEVVLGQQAVALGLGGRLAVDSAGTAADVGFDIDRRARRALERRGYSAAHRQARQFEPVWLDERDLVVAMDRTHLRWLERHAPNRAYVARVRLLLSHPGDKGTDEPLEVRDPYYGDERAFESCLDLIEAGCASLLDELAPELAPS